MKAFLNFLGELGSLILVKVRKHEKESYEKNRFKTNAQPADDFESKFNPHGLSDDSKVSSNNSDSRKGN